LPDGFSSTALTALEPMSSPTTALTLRNTRPLFLAAPDRPAVRVRPARLLKSFAPERPGASNPRTRNRRATSSGRLFARRFRRAVIPSCSYCAVSGGLPTKRLTLRRFRNCRGVRRGRRRPACDKLGQPIAGVVLSIGANRRQLDSRANRPYHWGLRLLDDVCPGGTSRQNEARIPC
jgi:hypothetical protein